MLMPVSTISRWPAASARRTSASTASGASDRSAPRARGMMQYVQKNEQPSCTLTKARVRSTDARSSATPSSGARRPPRRRTASAAADQRPAGDPVAAPAPRARRGARPCLVPDQAGRGVDGRERPRPDLHGAAGHDDLGVRVRAPRAADGVPALLVGDRGHGAGVDQHEVRPRGAVHERHATPRAAAGRAPSISDWLTLQPRLTIAAVRRRGDHHRPGFVLIRNADRARPAPAIA